MDNADIIDIFTSFFNNGKKGTKGAIRFLVKTLQQKRPIIDTSNKNLYKAYLLSIMANDERSLTKACSILIENQNEFPLNNNDFNCIYRLLDRHIDYEHDLEVIWLTYLLTKTNNFNIGNTYIKKILKTKNELAQLILLHYNLLQDEQQKEIVLKCKSWILLYEFNVRSVISNEDFIEKLNLTNNFRMYVKFKTKNIYFIR